eukprot:GEMP01075324.1.p1 GENE.GEMP01075324.1~~GEMP01075324.1.p1  ORF type:complete len:113 (-),score=8.62 GEMP01075324.1:424-762(-)
MDYAGKKNQENNGEKEKETQCKKRINKPNIYYKQNTLLPGYFNRLQAESCTLTRILAANEKTKQLVTRQISFSDITADKTNKKMLIRSPVMLDLGTSRSNAESDPDKKKNGK